MGKLENKIAIVTGAAQGMGESHARTLLKEGAKVVITDLNSTKGKALAEELGENVLFVKQDVTKEEEWKKVISETESTFGPINILVNNAGISFNKTFEECTLDDYMKIVNINQVSVFLGMKYVQPSMAKANGGSIINISSINGIVGGAVGYTDSKFAVRGITKAGALEFSKDNIRVNSIHPGVVETPMVTEGDSYEIVKEYAKTIPLGRMAKPQDISDLVLFLASEDSRYSTGSEFIVDGGITAQ
ncbi:glucose 1-dehydrogenase [Oceanobacillus sp. 143]|uniref:3-alpha-hydroxysteroid dehydrogenase n=1 Tax=Oceanobacillus zhaokaii TaxID=2052660 RepID=A0A345PLT3_9BACI|nr:glucose 1-dehydrogenase [Oceanobacillus zhaokaii]AXI10963.1 3-alpha-hydroxysteroid dehydrogenase [Oceanobacillus zhaokaii]QGS69793.1 glucose 1-dehydrogenase [Oceanobacillus sp. 143]